MAARSVGTEERIRAAQIALATLEVFERVPAETRQLLLQAVKTALELEAVKASGAANYSQIVMAAGRLKDVTRSMEMSFVEASDEYDRVTATIQEERRREAARYAGLKFGRVGLHPSQQSFQRLPDGVGRLVVTVFEGLEGQSPEFFSVGGAIGGSFDANPGHGQHQPVERDDTAVIVPQSLHQLEVLPPGLDNHAAQPLQGGFYGLAEDAVGFGFIHFSCSVVCDDPMERRVGGGGQTASADEGGDQ